MRAPRIGIAAEPFGFGPASKACAIARILTDNGVSVVPLTESIALQYFVKNGFSCEPIRPESISDQEISQLDAAVVCLDRGWLARLARHTKTFFVDSLAFMWDPGFFRFIAGLPLAGYVVQDVFDAVESARRAVSEVPLHPVGAIITKQESGIPSPRHGRHDRVASLGGFFTQSLSFDTTYYWSLVSQILSPVDGWAILAGNASVCHQARSMHLGHAEAFDYMSGADRLVTSPGLTTLLELAATQTPMVPLPPQNYSQVLIVRRMAEISSQQVWKWLSRWYRDIGERLPEAAGVAAVQTRTEELAHSNRFVATMRDLVFDTGSSEPPPHELCVNYNGASDVARLVIDSLR